MKHRMTTPITVNRLEEVTDSRNGVDLVPKPPFTVYVCIRNIESSWERKANYPVEWHYKATIAADLEADIKVNDVIAVPDYEGNFYVVEAKPARTFLSIVATQNKRGDER